MRANLTGLARGLFALYLLMLVAWGSQPDARGQLVAAIGIAIASVVGVMALGLSRVLHAAQLAATLLYMAIGLSPLVPFFTSPDASVVGWCGACVAHTSHSGRQRVARPLRDGRGECCRTH